MNVQKANKHGIFAFIILTIVIATNPIPSAFACPCPEIPDPLTALEKSTAVFTGSVLNIENINRSPLTGTSLKKVDFRINKAWKGIERTKISVNTEKDTTTCGYEFSIGNNYLVYAQGKKDDLQASLCSRTQKLINVSPEELATLGKPTFLPEDEDWPPFNLISDHPIPSLSALVTLIVLVIISLLRKFKATQFLNGTQQR